MVSRSLRYIRNSTSTIKTQNLSFLFLDILSIEVLSIKFITRDDANPHRQLDRSLNIILKYIEEYSKMLNKFGDLIVFVKRNV